MFKASPCLILLEMERKNDQTVLNDVLLMPPFKTNIVPIAVDEVCTVQ